MARRKVGSVSADADTNKLIGAINRAFSTEDGKHALRFLFELCDFHGSSIGGNREIGADVLVGTYFNEARRSVYIDLRRMIRADILKDVEFYEPKPEDKE